MLGYEAADLLLSLHDLFNDRYDAAADADKTMRLQGGVAGAFDAEHPVHSCSGAACLVKVLVFREGLCVFDPNARKNRTEPPIQGLTAHIFRHNFCSELCYQVPEISTKMIAKLLGDDERMVLEVYSHIVAEKENVAESLSKAFKRSQ